jgi:PAS domain S-box-containing protein
MHVSVRIKSIILAVGFVLAVALVLGAVSRFVIERGFSRLEEEQVVRDTGRAEREIDHELEALDRTLRDWSSWDDTYRFLLGENPEYVEENLAPETFAYLRLTAMVAMDPAGRVVHGQGFGLATGTLAPLPAGFGSLPPLASPSTGLARLNGGLFLLASRPVLKSDGSGPPAGRLVMARELDAREVGALSRRISLDLGILPPGDPAIPVTARAGGKGSAPVVAVLSRDTVAGFVRLRDMTGGDAGWLRVTERREIHAAGLKTTRVFLLSSVAAMLVLLVLLITVPNRLMVRRILHLEGRLSDMRESEDWSLRMPVEGDDEIARLAEDINRTLDLLAASRQQQAESEERYRALVESSPDGIMVHRGPCFLFINPAATRLLGLDGSDGPPRDGFDVMDADDRARIEALATGVMEGTIPSGSVAEAQRTRQPDGAKLYLEGVFTRVHFGGEPAVQVMLRDVTQRHRFQEDLEEKVARRTVELAALNEDLRLSEERFRTVVTSMEDVVFLLGRDQRYLGIWGRWLEKNGLSPEMFLGKTSWEIFGEQDRPFFDPLNQRVLHGETIAYERWFDVPMGRVFYHTTLSPIRDASGAVIGIVGLGRDITDRKRDEVELEKAKENLERQNEELKKLDRIKDGLLRDVTHELKTPVAKHHMQVEILHGLIDGTDLGEQTTEAFRVIDASLKRQEQVIRNILDLSRLEAGGRRYKREPIRLDELLGVVLEDHSYDFTVAGITIERDLPRVEIVSDGEMLWHAISNVLGNAVKFHGKTDRPVIAVTLAAEDGGATIVIRDNGIGLTEEQKGRVFERFYKGYSVIEGSGVGLNITKRIVEDLGGSIALESDGEGKGATVVMHLPLESPEPNHSSD